PSLAVQILREPFLAIDGERERLAHPCVVKGSLVGAEGESAHGEAVPELHGIARIGRAEAGDLGAWYAGGLPRTVHLARTEEPELSRAILDEEPFDLVEVGQAARVVVRVAGEDALEPGLVPLEHEGPAADEGLRPSDVTQLVLDLGRHDAVPRIGEVVEEGRIGLGEDDADRARIRR